jgi:hypothetical protein
MSAVKPTAAELKELGIDGATDEISFFDYTILHLKDTNFVESSPNKDKVWGESLTGYIQEARRQWLVQALTNKAPPGKLENWIVADNKTDLFFTLDAPDLGDEGRFNRDGDSLAEWVQKKAAEGKVVGDNTGKEYLMVLALLADGSEEVIIQVAPSSAKYRWPSFVKRQVAAARRLAPGATTAQEVAAAMRRVKVKFSAGKKVTEVANPFWPMEFTVV